MKFFCIARPNTEISWKTETGNKTRDNISGKIYNVNNFNIFKVEHSSQFHSHINLLTTIEIVSIIWVAYLICEQHF